MNFISEEEIDRVLGKINNKSNGSKVKGEILEYFTEEKLKTPVSHQKTINNNIYTEDKYKAFKEAHTATNTTRRRTTRISKPYIEQEFTRKVRRVSFNPELTSNTVNTVNTSLTRNTINKRTITRTLARKNFISEKAGFVAKTSAIFADMSIVALVQSFILFVSYKVLGKEAFYSLLKIQNINTTNAIELGTTMLIAYIAIFAFYLMFFESLSGQTLGKGIMKIKIANAMDSEKPSISTIILRSALFFVLFPLSLFGIHNKITKTAVKKI